jgi:hypothetical protein
MNRVAGLVLAGLVFLLLGVTLTQSSPAQAQVVCPASSGSPGIECDANCFHHCCLTSGLCPSTSCKESVDAATDARTLCAGRCLDEVQCNPFNPDCGANNEESCIGTISCIAGNCAGRHAGSICLYSGGTSKFRICDISQ